jgi:nucleoside-diphosphate kinase
MEHTLIIIKPDALQRSLTGSILQIFEQRGFQIMGIKMTHGGTKQLEEHYAHIAHIDAFPEVIAGMQLAPLIVIVLAGSQCVKIVKEMVGATDPSKADLNSIRGKFAQDMGRNVCHASDSVENANKEIGIWFTKEEIFNWTSPIENLLVRK